MDLGKAKGYIGLGIVTELYKLRNDHIVVEVGKSFRCEFSPGFQAGVFVQRIIIAKVVFI